jgi:hypothetical protein
MREPSPEARDAHDRRIAEREVELAARDKRTKDLLAQAETDRAKAAELKAGWERKMKAFDAA